MSARGTPGPAREHVARATALIRALTGVVDARVEADASGIRTIAVVVEPALSAWEITRNVQSALLASLGLAIDTAIVEVRRPQPEAPAPDEPERLAPDGPVERVEPVAPVRNGRARSLGAARGNGKPAANGRPAANGKPASNGNGKAGWAAQANGKSNGKSNGKPHPPVPGPGAAVPGAVASVAPGKKRGASVARVELETRPGGRVGCRVVVATSDRIAAGQAEGVDTPAGRLEAAARAVIGATGLAGLDIDAVRLVELAGRNYVIVAVRAWSGRELLYRAEVVAVDASPEAAAAEATLGAILR